MADNNEKNVEVVETVWSFVPYVGEYVAGMVKLIYFLGTWGEKDPIQQALEFLQKQIDELKIRMDQFNERLNQLVERISYDENKIRILRINDRTAELRLLMSKLSLRPVDTYNRRSLALEAASLADGILNDPDIWLWTDIRVKKTFDGYERLVREEKTLEPPDFKNFIIPHYIHALQVLTVAIDLDTGGDPVTVQARYGDVLQRHIEQKVNPTWLPPGSPATLAENVKARIRVYTESSYKYAANRECIIDIMCENSMERTKKFVRSERVFMADPGPEVLCTWSPNLGDFDQQMVEDRAGVEVLRDASEAMRTILSLGSLRPPFSGQFAMTPVVQSAKLFGIKHDGSVDFFEQDIVNEQVTAAAWTGPVPINTDLRDFIKILPAGSGLGLFALHTSGDLFLFSYEKPGEIHRVGEGWNVFLSIIPGGDGVLYAIQPDGKLLWYRRRDADWVSGTLAESGWDEYRFVFSVGFGRLYAVDGDGKLLWFQEIAVDEYTHRLIGGPKTVGFGWQDFRDIFGTGYYRSPDGTPQAGFVYALLPDGVLRQYFHGGWETGGDVNTWREPSIAAFNMGSYRQTVTQMSGRIVLH
jgi:hypothetical protein